MCMTACSERAAYAAASSLSAMSAHASGDSTSFTSPTLNSTYDVRLVVSTSVEMLVVPVGLLFSAGAAYLVHEHNLPVCPLK